MRERESQQMRRAVEALAAYVGPRTSTDLANEVMTRMRDEGWDAFEDLAIGLLFVSGYLIAEVATSRGQPAMEVLQELALKVAPTGE